MYSSVAGTSGELTAANPFSRRGFLIMLTGAAVTFGFTHPDAAVALTDRPKLLFEPTIWYSIDSDGVVTVSITRAEMGQHIGTALARIVADELEADWKKVRIATVDSDPKWGVMITGGSWSVWQSFPVLSRAGAAGRITLLEEGARLLGVPVSECVARNGLIHAGGRSITFGKIVAEGRLNRTFKPEDLSKLPIKSASERRFIGRDTQALDIPSKVDGSGRYGLDASITGMVFGRPLIPPTRYGSKVVSVDDEKAKHVPGYHQCLVLDDPSGSVSGWVLVIAESFTAADRAARLVHVNWKSGQSSATSEQDIQKRAAELIAESRGGSLLVDDPGVDAAFTASSKKIERTYTTSTVLHYALEPVNAVAFQKDGTFEIHTGNQWQSLALPVLAKALDCPQEKILMRSYLLGGGFGRRLDPDHAIPAALAAKALGKPVKVVLTRADDSRVDSPRSPSTQVIRMACGAHGEILAMEHHAAAGWPTAVMAPALMAPGLNRAPYDIFAISGADHWYNVGAQKVRALRNDLAERTFRPGWVRSVGPGWIDWAVESFMDEAAYEMRVDPVAFRLKLLDGKGRNIGSSPNSVGGAHRQAAVLKRLADKVSWGSPLPKDVGLGVATSFGQERTMPTWAACAAQVRVDRSSGHVSVKNLTLVMDPGTVIHPDGAKAQVEGAALWGLSMALHEGTEYEKGQPKGTNLDSYQLLRMGAVPEIDIEFLPSTEAPMGLGEPGTTVVAPAIANAIFAATGARLRHLPIRPSDVLQALRDTRST